MGIPRFRNNVLIKEFNGLKRFFRSHETRVSRQRIRDFKKFVELIKSTGDEVAFDMMGSVNFGQAREYSDTDIVIYLKCDPGNIKDCSPKNCSRLNLYKNLLINTLVYEYSQKTYHVQVVDCINLNQLEHDIQFSNLESLAIVKFAFYRSICRGINRKFLRSYEDMLSKNDTVCSSVEKSITDCFAGLVRSSQHDYSFKKYTERIEEAGFKVPQTMTSKIHRYLGKSV